jgi:hypothetical protein
LRGLLYGNGGVVLIGCFWIRGNIVIAWACSIFLYRNYNNNIKLWTYPALIIIKLYNNIKTYLIISKFFPQKNNNILYYPNKYNIKIHKNNTTIIIYNL